MTLDDLIRHLEEIRDEHGGELEVWIAGRDGWQEQGVRTVKYDFPYPGADKNNHQEGVLIRWTDDNS